MASEVSIPRKGEAPLGGGGAGHAAGGGELPAGAYFTPLASSFASHSAPLRRDFLDSPAPADALDWLPSRPQVPAALQVYRRGRWCTVAKVVRPRGWQRPVLAVVYRHRQALAGRLSLPELVLRYGLQAGAEELIVRFDADGVAYRLPLEEALRVGERRREHGLAEVYVYLDDMERCGWVDWSFTTKIVRLGPHLADRPRQLALDLRTAAARPPQYWDWQDSTEAGEVGR